MTDTVTREEFKQREGRVQVIEREADGEKRVTRYILDQVRHNADDLAVIKTRLDRMETDISHVKTDVGQLKTDVAHLKTDVGLSRAEVRTLRAELPKIIAETMREVLREHRG